MNLFLSSSTIENAYIALKDIKYTINFNLFCFHLFRVSNTESYWHLHTFILVIYIFLGCRVSLDLKKDLHANKEEEDAYIN